jgi:uncharacterized protein YndB with AHSA1/START domain
MYNIYHNFPIAAPLNKVFDCITQPEGLDVWWTKKSSGVPELNQQYVLWFAPEYDWRAIVSRCEPARVFELTMTVSDKDWQGTKLGFELKENKNIVSLNFYHVNWPENNEHYRISSFCWAMYLRLLKRYLEYGEIIDYEKRLDA